MAMELRAIHWIGYLTTFFTNRTQRVVVNESYSCWSYLVISGITQGSVATGPNFIFSVH